MKRNTVTFQRIEKALEMEPGVIRSIDVNHERRFLIVITDEGSRPVGEMATIHAGTTFLSDETYDDGLSH